MARLACSLLQAASQRGRLRWGRPIRPSPSPHMQYMQLGAIWVAAIRVGRRHPDDMQLRGVPSLCVPSCHLDGRSSGVIDYSYEPCKTCRLHALLPESACLVKAALAVGTPPQHQGIHNLRHRPVSLVSGAWCAPPPSPAPHPAYPAPALQLHAQPSQRLRTSRMAKGLNRKVLLGSDPPAKAFIERCLYSS